MIMKKLLVLKGFLFLIVIAVVCLVSMSWAAQTFIKQSNNDVAAIHEASLWIYVNEPNNSLILAQDTFNPVDIGMEVSDEIRHGIIQNVAFIIIKIDLAIARAAQKSLDTGQTTLAAAAIYDAFLIPGDTVKPLIIGMEVGDDVRHRAIPYNTRVDKYAPYLITAQATDGTKSGKTCEWTEMVYRL